MCDCACVLALCWDMGTKISIICDTLWIYVSGYAILKTRMQSFPKYPVHSKLWWQFTKHKNQNLHTNQQRASLQPVRVPTSILRNIFRTNTTPLHCKWFTHLNVLIPQISDAWCRAQRTRHINKGWLRQPQRTWHMCVCVWVLLFTPRCTRRYTTFHDI